MKQTIMHKRGEMLSMDALGMGPRVSLTIQPIAASCTAGPELIKLVHSKIFDEKDEKERIFGLVNKHIFIENEPEEKVIRLSTMFLSTIIVSDW